MGSGSGSNGEKMGDTYSNFQGFAAVTVTIKGALTCMALVSLSGLFRWADIISGIIK